MHTLAPLTKMRPRSGLSPTKSFMRGKPPLLGSRSRSFAGSVRRTSSYTSATRPRSRAKPSPVARPETLLPPRLEPAIVTQASEITAALSHSGARAASPPPRMGSSFSAVMSAAPSALRPSACSCARSAAAAGAAALPAVLMKRPKVSASPAKARAAKTTAGTAASAHGRVTLRLAVTPTTSQLPVPSPPHATPRSAANFVSTRDRSQRRAAAATVAACALPSSPLAPGPAASSPTAR